MVERACLLKMFLAIMEWLGTVLRSAQPFLPIFTVVTHLSVGSVDGVEVSVQSTVASNHVKDGSVAHLVLVAVVVRLVDNRELIGSYD